MGEVVDLYADGGVILKNPSPIGGTWAFCGIDEDDEMVISGSGYILSPAGRFFTNNWSEQVAIVKALEAVPDGWSGRVLSDSNIALGRVFKGWRTTNLPRNVSDRARDALRRLGRVEMVLLQGHPTKRDLEVGIGAKRNLPVSKWNDWCDKACKEQGVLGLEAYKLTVTPW